MLWTADGGLMIDRGGQGPMHLLQLHGPNYARSTNSEGRVRDHERISKSERIVGDAHLKYSSFANYQAVPHRCTEAGILLIGKSMGILFHSVH